MTDEDRIDTDELEVFQAERPRLWNLAYRMLGIADDADEVVQDAWLRWQTTDQSGIANPAAWLTTVTTRLALDRLRSAQRQREAYVGPWLPEPVGTEAWLSRSGPGAGAAMSGYTGSEPTSVVGGADADPLQAAVFAESLSLGFLAVLERLNPVERAVFLLHDVFGMPFAEVAPVVDRTPAAARQIAVRARDRIEAGRPRFAPDPVQVERLAEAFFAAAGSGDQSRLEALLTDDAVLVSDGGGVVRAARHPIVGPMRIARFLTGLAKRVTPEYAFHPVRINGQAGVYITFKGEPDSVITITWEEAEPTGDGAEDTPTHRATQICVVRNPDKLRRFAASWAGGG